MKNDSIQCELCNQIVGIQNGDIVTIEFIAWKSKPQWVELLGCERCKNGYCAFFRMQAELDKITFNMHDRNCEK